MPRLMSPQRERRMPMIDFSRLKTLEQVQAQRTRLEYDVCRRRQCVQQDMQSIHSLWISRKRTISNIFHVIEYIIPKPQTKKTLLGILLSTLATRILRLIHHRKS